VAGIDVSLQLTVRDLNTAEAFYAGILELNVERALTVRGAPEHLILRHGGWEIIFVEEEAVVHAHPILADRFEEYPKGVGMTIHVTVDDVTETYEAVLEEELEILYPLEQKPYGVKEFWCFDPDGYLLVVEEARSQR
jgi:uncharacterized glyoxalase superfamily protein PhnB